MSKMTKIMMGIWAFLAIVSFICAFFCPLFPKIIGLTFGGLNILVILTYIIAYFQQVYYVNKLNKDDGTILQLQEEADKEATA